MGKRLLVALLVAFALVGVYQAGSFGAQLRTDYQNFKKIVTWVAIQQQREEAARQRAQRQAPQPTPQAAQTPVPAK